MNLHHLSVFHAIAETGSITAAARRLHISQPALSRELRTFEDRLGVILFERRPKGMQLTQAGTILRDYAQRLFTLERAAEAAMREAAGARVGRLDLGASNTIGTYVLPKLLARFRSEHPRVGVSLFVGNTEQVSQGVADMRFMLGFIEGPLHLQGLRATTFQDDEIVPVVAAEHPLAKKRRLRVGDVSGQPLLMREEGSGTRELIAGLLMTHGIEAGSVMEFGNAEALKQAALHGSGVAWLPRISVQEELRRGALRELPLTNLTILRPLSVLQRDGAYVDPLMTSFLRLVRPDK